MKTKKYVVNVTAKDIKGAKTGSPTNCPIARACRRQGLERVFVACGEIAYGRSKENGRKKKIMNIPKKASKFITRFDFGYPVKPFAFAAQDTGEYDYFY